MMLRIYLATMIIGLAGCVNDGVLGPPMTTSDTVRAAPTTVGADSAAPATAGTTSGVPDIASMPVKPEAFNPFRDATAGAGGGREIIAEPSFADVMQPVGLPEIAVGRPDAPVTVVKYMSLTCPYCRQFQLSAYPEIKRRYIDTGKVRFVFREFPIGMQSGAATIALRCAPASSTVDLYEALMANQARWVSQEVRLEPIAAIVAKHGVTREQFDACRQDAALVEGLKAVKERGRTLGIVGTPNFFVNRRLVKSVLDARQLSELIEQALAAGPVAATPIASRRSQPSTW